MDVADPATPSPPPLPVPVVGIGASAGGLQPLEALTARLSTGTMAFVVLQHLGPGHDSLLTEILARDTSFTVETARDGAEIEPGRIYVAPPGVDVTVGGGLLHLSAPADRAPRHSIDTLFRSMARELGSHAIGVVLSGVGSDGTSGLRAIKAAGGISFAQDPVTAAQPGMPQSALDAGCVDFCLRPDEIGDHLTRLAAHPYLATTPSPPRIDDASRARILEIVRRASGVDFSTYKETTIDRRIERRMALSTLDQVGPYLARLEASPAEQKELYGDLLIGVTGFFRDRAPFELLKSVVLPRLVEGRSPEAPIRVWVPGCSTGEEAYSVAICLLEHLEHRSTSYRVQIFATDIDDDALAYARHALYSKHAVADVAPERLERFFTRVEDGYQVARQVRDLVVFAHHNLGKDPPFSRLDLVTCRNVLIYMQPALQKRVLHSLHYALNPDAFLLLGSSESVGDSSELFSLVDRKLRLYTKKNIASAAVFDFAAGGQRELGDPQPLAGIVGPRTRPPLVSAQQLADRKVLDRFAPPGVLVDDQLEIVQFRGNTGPFLAPSPGVATLNLLKLVRPELHAELRLAIAKTATDGLPVTTPPVPLLHADGTAIVVDVIPIHEGGEHRRALLVLFRDAATVSPTPVLARREPAAGGPPEVRVEELERELLVTKEYLQTSVQDLQTTNEELQSANEELQSANEELQSTNEELETSKEELMSTNEELSTVNEELQNRMAQLGESNDDLQNLLGHVSVPVVIVGMDLRLRRFSDAAERLLDLVPGDLGRPVGYLGAALDAAPLEAVVAETIHTAREHTQRVRCSNGQWYTLRTFPYRTAEHAIHGAVLELLKAPPGRKAGDLPEVHEFAGKVLSSLPNVLMLLDDQLRVVWVNRAFFDTFLVGTEILGQPLDEIFEGARADAALWPALEEAVAGRRALDDLRVEHPLGQAHHAPMTFSSRSLAAEGERAAMTLVIIKEAPDPVVAR